MIAPLLTITFPDGQDGYDLRRVFSPLVAAAHREGRLRDGCSSAGLTMRRLEVLAGGMVVLLPE